MKELFGQGARAFVLSNFSFAINFAGNLALVRILTPHIFGTYALAIALIGGVEVFTTFALQTVYLQRRPSKRLLAAIIQAFLGIGALKCLGVAFLFLMLREHYGAQVWTLFAVIFAAKLLVPLNALLIAMLEKQFRFARSAFITAISNSTSVVAAVATGLLGGGIYSLAVRDVLPILIGLWIGLWLNRSTRVNLGRFDWRQSRTLMRSGMEMYAVRASELGFSKLPIILVERLFGIEVLGYLHQALYLVNSVNRVTMMLNQQVALVYFNRYRRDRAKTRQGFSILLALSMGLGILVAPPLILFPHLVVQTLWGDEWIAASEMLRVMSALIFIIPVFTILKSQLYGQRRTLWLAGTYLAGSVVIVALLFSLKAAHAPAVAVSLAYLATFALMAAGAARGLFPGAAAGTGASGEASARDQGRTSTITASPSFQVSSD
jgi:O-antigen/teichoic acid export membrane protein